MCVWSSNFEPCRCQEKCSENQNCTQFTWLTEEANNYQRTCFLFLSPDTPEDCTNCVSGPRSCTCGSIGQCEDVGNNLLDMHVGVTAEVECQQLCGATTSCTYYTWFDRNAPSFENICFLYKFCPSLDDSCGHCFSGPPSCGATTVTASSDGRSTTLATTTPPSMCDQLPPPPPKHGYWFCQGYSSTSAVCHLECDQGEGGYFNKIYVCEMVYQSWHL